MQLLTDNETAITTEDIVEGKPSDLLDILGTGSEAEDEIQDIEEQQQTEQAQQQEGEDEAQTPQVRRRTTNRTSSTTRRR